MKRGRITRICQASPLITVAALTAANGCANIADNDKAFGAAQIVTAALVVALTITQTRETQ